MNILIVTIKEWNIKNYFILKEKYKNYNFFLITNKDEITIENISNITPDYIFFPHWSWLIPDWLYTNYKSILFHMTDLPFGRGGSPLQNLIIRKIYNTTISAIDVDKDLDSGNIYIQRDLDISLGSAEEIFIKLSDIIFFDMIPYIIKYNLQSTPQNGKIEYFKRRDKKDSEIKNINSIRELYDFIRMLDADGYPKAFIKLDNFKIEFSEVHLKTDKLIGRFEIEKVANSCCPSR